ncbi:hypothetical protein CMO89_01100 [Candidatus Woesearchaeota archaeon]|nr:hypothetical protein [Candidatus Woesearchaeota archaeon]|tara:strand:- start:10405 stop:10752 length:348 start_codon:yes stop_codon:yes gene_type:complete
MKEEGGEFSYIRIRDNLEFRRNILGYLKGVIQLLQRHEQIKSIREEKIERVMQLKGVLLELSKLNMQLRLEMPKVSVPSRKAGGSSKVIGAGKANQLEMLEEELGDIESKLKGLV